ncbi:MAG: MBL fold metallo-hydrolase, partial [Myxococcales bacterium]|nr:MBL fold metallo-hydrolase [Myxococcales bacterium]
ERSESIVGLVVTHGHEDHVGGVTHFLRDFKAPVYGSPFTMARPGRCRRRCATPTPARWSPAATRSPSASARAAWARSSR